MESQDNGGGSSGNPHRNDDGRPFKKARYLWQVKGKHHLKKDHQEMTRRQETPHEAPTTSRASIENENNLMTDESADNINNNVIINNNIEPCCRDSILAQIASLTNPNNSESSSSADDSDDSDNRLRENSEVYDPRLTRWQANQLARGFVDNAINSALDITHRSHDCSWDATDAIDDSERFRLEDEAISAAIQEQGLFYNDIEVIPAFERRQYHYMLRDILVTNRLEREQQNRDGASPIGSDVDLVTEHSEDVDDFMNEAVSVAIQQKGLSSHCA